MTARVSVALATYNGEAYLAQQLRSILAQTVPVTQIVIADDGSRDGTLALAQAELAEFVAARGELLVLEPSTRSLGVTRNFERALNACTGEVIALCDQDDVWHPDKIERMLATLGDGLLAFSDARLVDAAGASLDGDPLLFGGLGVTDWERERLQAGDAWTVFLRRNLVTGATAVLRRSLLDLAGEFPEAWVHDEWLAIVAAAHGGVRMLDAPTIDYRQHGANQIGMRSKLTWNIRMERLRAPRTMRNHRLLKRAEALAARAHEWSEEAALDAEEKLAHEQVRSALPVYRLERITPIRREAATGRYDRFGLGKQDILRDLLQPGD